MYCDERRGILWNIAWARRTSKGQSPRYFLRAHALFYPISRHLSHNTEILNCNSSIVLPGILCIALTAGAIFSILSNRFFSVLFLHNGPGISEFSVYAFQEGQYGFRRANTDSGVPIKNSLCILGRPIRNRLFLLGGPIWKTIRNRI